MLLTFVLSKPFHLSLKFVGKASSLPKRRAAERCSTQVGFDLSPKHWARLAKNKGLTLFCIVVTAEGQNKLECSSLASLSSLV